jgi:hypothetical protein
MGIATTSWIILVNASYPGYPSWNTATIALEYPPAVRTGPLQRRCCWGNIARDVSASSRNQFAFTLLGQG